MKNKLILLIGLILMTSALMIFSIRHLPLSHSKSIRIESSYKDEPVTLKGKYYYSKNSEYVMVIATGYSCDRTKWKSIAELFVKNGISVLTFDFSGQASSYGKIGFDNAKTDYISVEIDDAIERAHEISGVDYEKMIVLGHSMGGRAILRLLYDYNNPSAETTVTPKNIGNVILMSPEVNYNYNAQASLFAGTSDESDPIWRDYSYENLGNTNVYLYGSTSDDVVDDHDILDIYSHIGGQNVPESGKYKDTQNTPNGNKITVGIVSGVLHSYQMYSYQFAVMLNEAFESITSLKATYQAWTFHLIYIGWALGLVGLTLVFYYLGHNEKWIPNDLNMTLVDEKKFLLRKLLMWIPGIGMAFVICSICVAMPFGSPIMNIPYMCFIAGYGLVMLLAYRKGTFKGTEGKLPRLSFKAEGNKKELIKAIIITISLIAYISIVLLMSMFKMFTFNIRIFWLIFASLLMSVGYYISGAESDMIDSSSKKTKILYSLIQYVPLFLFVMFYFVIKSYSGFIGQVQNMVLMYLFCIPLGNYVKRKTGNRLYGSILTSITFQALMITSAAIISMF